MRKCVRCGRRDKMLTLCLSCELFVNRLTLPGVKPEGLDKAKDYVRSGALRRIGSRPVFKASSTLYNVGRVYRTSNQSCTCPSGVYRGLNGASCYHSYAAQLLNARSR